MESARKAEVAAIVVRFAGVVITLRRVATDKTQLQFGAGVLTYKGCSADVAGKYLGVLEMVTGPVMGPADGDRTGTNFDTGSC